MDKEMARIRLSGCYVTIPTMFRDEDLELVGLGSSRCRPPTRDVRDEFRDRARRMLVQCGVPGIVGRNVHSQKR